MTYLTPKLYKKLKMELLRETKKKIDWLNKLFDVSGIPDKKIEEIKRGTR